MGKHVWDSSRTEADKGSLELVTVTTSLGIFGKFIVGSRKRATSRQVLLHLPLEHWLIT